MENMIRQNGKKKSGKTNFFYVEQVIGPPKIKDPIKLVKTDEATGEEKIVEVENPLTPEQPLQKQLLKFPKPKKKLTEKFTYQVDEYFRNKNYNIINSKKE